MPNCGQLQNRFPSSVAYNIQCTVDGRNPAPKKPGMMLPLQKPTNVNVDPILVSPSLLIRGCPWAIIPFEGEHPASNELQFHREVDAMVWTLEY